MHTLVNCKSSYFFRNYIMQQPDCTIFTLEMAHIDSDDTAVGSIKIIVFHIGRQASPSIEAPAPVTNATRRTCSRHSSE